MFPSRFVSILLAFCTWGQLRAQAPDSGRDVKPILAHFCVRCHGPQTEEGNVRLDNLDDDLVNGPDAERWHAALDMINQGDMPPEDEPQLPPAKLERLTSWIQTNLQLAAESRRTSNRQVMRRLTREQYTNTLQSLLEVDVNFGDALAEDGKSKSGFSNNGSVLQTTPLHLQYYQKIAREALDQAIFLERPEVFHYRIRLGENIGTKVDGDLQIGKYGGYRSAPIDPKHVHGNVLDLDGNVLWETPDSRPANYKDVLRSLGAGMRGSDKSRYVMAPDGLLMDSAVPHVERAPTSWHGPSPNLKMLIRQYFPAKGNFAFRVTAAKVASRDEADRHRTPALQVSLGNRTDDGMDSRHFDRIQPITTPVGHFKTYTFTGRLENLPVPQVDLSESNKLANIMVIGVWNRDFVKNKKEWGSRIQVSEVEFQAPFFETWPPRSHKKIFFDSPHKSDPEVYAREILNRFIAEAFRRPTRPRELELYYEFWNDIRHDYDTFEEAIKETLVAVLSSPKLIFLVEMADEEKTAVQKEYELASRLSYFLWNSPPDDQLYELASKQKLRKQLSAEIPRLVEDERSWRFIKMFCDQWLKVYRHHEMQVDVRTHPTFTRYVKSDMARETYHYVRHVLTEDLSVLKLIQSDFTLLNQNLAEFYGIPDVLGPQFRVVHVSPAMNRGGLLTQGAFLSGHSDGRQAHPIKRALWLMERILGESPPPPPPNVPELDAEAAKSGKLSIAEQLAVHRNRASCRNCHQKLDPYGLVFEDFNGAGLPNRNAGRNPDTKVTLPNQITIDGVDAMKSYIVDSQRDAFTRSLIEHLMAYALGRDMSFADDEAIDEIVAYVAEQDYKFQAVVEGVVTSPLFTQED